MHPCVAGLLRNREPGFHHRSRPLGDLETRRLSEQNDEPPPLIVDCPTHVMEHEIEGAPEAKDDRNMILESDEQIPAVEEKFPRSLPC